MQSGTRIFAPFIFSRMNDMKSWFSSRGWRPTTSGATSSTWGTCGGEGGGGVGARARRRARRGGRGGRGGGGRGGQQGSHVDDESGGEHVELEAEEAEVLHELDLVLAVADEALVERRRLLGLRHEEVRLVADRVEAGDLGGGRGELQGENLGTISVGPTVNTVVRAGVIVTDGLIRFKGGYSHANRCASLSAIRSAATSVAASVAACRRRLRRRRRRRRRRRLPRRRRCRLRRRLRRRRRPRRPCRCHHRRQRPRGIPQVMGGGAVSTRRRLSRRTLRLSSTMEACLRPSLTFRPRLRPPTMAPVSRLYR